LNVYGLCCARCERRQSAEKTGAGQVLMSVSAASAGTVSSLQSVVFRDNAHSRSVLGGGREPAMLFVVCATDKTDILPTRAKFYRAAISRQP